MSLRLYEWVEPQPKWADAVNRGLFNCADAGGWLKQVEGVLIPGSHDEAVERMLAAPMPAKALTLRESYGILLDAALGEQGGMMPETLWREALPDELSMWALVHRQMPDVGGVVPVAAGALVIEHPENYQRICLNKRHPGKMGSGQRHPVDYGWTDPEGRAVRCEGGPWAIIVPLDEPAASRKDSP